MPEEYRPLTPSTWTDFEQLMGVHQGGDSGCWCTWWRLPRSEWNRLDRNGRKNSIKQSVDTGHPVGLIVYQDTTPFGWCAIAPSQDYPVIGRSPVIAPSMLDGDWFVSCFFVKAGYRRSGAMRLLLEHAVDYA